MSDETRQMLKQGLASRITDCKELVKGFQLAKKMLADGSDDELEVQLGELVDYVGQLNQRTIAIKLLMEMAKP